jgi:hypothetical protein
VKCGDEIPLNQWFLVEALSPPLYLYYLTLRWLIKEVKVILGLLRTNVDVMRPKSVPILSATANIGGLRFGQKILVNINVKDR